MERKCNTCGHIGPLEDFVPARRYRYGVRPNCRRCVNQLNRKRMGYRLDKPYEKREKKVYIHKWDVRRIP